MNAMYVSADHPGNYAKGILWGPFESSDEHWKILCGKCSLSLASPLVVNQGLSPKSGDRGERDDPVISLNIM
ncbi:hypothetical protein Ddc_09645 [Ditylenchus destructor]|nr:hypothetical protein Ddc_09645 [Ditylenchus destructor]